jgi:hypothetical protein
VRLSPTSGRWRLLRGGAVSTLSVLLTVIGHTAAGGTAPDAGLVVVLGLLLTGLLVALGDRQPSLGALLLALGGAQLCMHILLDALASHAHSEPASPPGGGLSMITVHLVLTVITGWLLRGADRALFALAAMLARVLPRPVLPLVPQPVPSVACLAAPPAGGWLLDVLFRRMCLRRGPPLQS